MNSSLSNVDLPSPVLRQSPVIVAPPVVHQELELSSQMSESSQRLVIDETSQNTPSQSSSSLSYRSLSTEKVNDEVLIKTPLTSSESPLLIEYSPTSDSQDSDEGMLCGPLFICV